jgi:hypothetical protein
MSDVRMHGLARLNEDHLSVKLFPEALQLFLLAPFALLITFPMPLLL